METLLLLGANMGEIKKTFLDARNKLNRIGSILRASSLYSSPSWGFKANDFINQALIYQTNLQPQKLIYSILAIEKELGRERKALGYESRVIDIDIILIKDTIINSKELVVPHPKMQERKFVLVPCNEIADNWLHPLLNKKISELLLCCEDTSIIKKIE
jgi:2-amino-4-hydroxy-6-hydroxymethyldihydropteridine diphosphokinase